MLKNIYKVISTNYLNNIHSASFDTSSAKQNSKQQKKKMASIRQRNKFNKINLKPIETGSKRNN